MVSHLRLPFAFDPVLLQRDLATIRNGEWTRHFNTQYYEGDWSGIALRSTAGARVPLYPDPTSDVYVDLPVLAECPYFREVLETFRCPVQVARLLRLKPGTIIREHRDYRLGYEDGEIRVHVPVETNPEVEFVLDGERLTMREGEAWYLNVNLPHRVHNGGRADRVHLVVDCTVNDWVRRMFPGA